ncbi:Descriminating glutamyl-tRNA synthetase [gamma proteobacterium HdN1]|nr:Descriminating glutamyl-tRNA synthetase [gamma proteobacterium HdN1]
MPPSPYIGRFAPSPTGLLHLGSLLTAVASYCDARASQGKWLVRIEDIDPLREVAGASSAILNTLEGFGLYWDDEVIFQSQRLSLYQDTIDTLLRQGRLFYCTCSRKQLIGHVIYPGTCRPQKRPPEGIAWALKAEVPHREYSFIDPLQGRFGLRFGEDAGDFVIQRKEGFIAYHLAVVLDDAAQNITHIVRGADLLDSTPYHLLLQDWLQLPTPHYMHLPVITNTFGQKLSKQTGAMALSTQQRSQQLVAVLAWLGQNPEAGLAQEPVSEVLAWAVAHWQSKNIPHHPTLAR